MFERKCEYEDMPYLLSGYDSISTEIVKTAHEGSCDDCRWKKGKAE